MPTIRDVVRALGRRDEVDAIIVLGRDGLPIDAHAKDGIDADSLAALVPPIVEACDRLGQAVSRGGFGTGLVEYAGGIALVAELSSEALLVMVFKPGANIGGLLYELARHRPAIAGLL